MSQARCQPLPASTLATALERGAEQGGECEEGGGGGGGEEFALTLFHLETSLPHRSALSLQQPPDTSL